SDMSERETLLRIAPHLVSPLPFLLPLYRPSLWYRFKLRIGMQLYDALSLDKSLPKREWLDRGETLAAEPALDPDGLQGAWRFYDAQVPLVERLVIENIVDAAAHGALVLNHARATSYLREGDRVDGAVVQDRIAGADLEVRARLTINATGPWLDRTIAPLRRTPKPLLRLTKGIHIVTPRATRQAHVLFAKRDGRLFFVVPWLDATIVGTTDTDYKGDPADAAATEEDVRYLQAEARRAFPDAPFDEIYFTWAGVRALVREEGVSEGQVSRKHALFDHQRRDGVAGVLSVVGGKITAYRAIAEEVTDLAAERLGGPQSSPGRQSLTASMLLPGAGGSRAREIAGLAAGDASLAAPLCAHQHGIAAEIAHAVRREWAMTIGDALLRRTTLGLAPCQGLDCLDAVAELMGRLLGWDPERRRGEIAAYRREIEPMRRFSIE
ncbi:MAG TPA: glycerol-3-phosphate dehydrogenase/oxidase, partial [Candidatus Limnocylindria bacterium]|nr:glycerol-3-phosphate dehydrogenase/oxidase [Candidatus Limnocylindria bacterium]